MGSKRGQREIRFAAGAPDGLHGSVYRVWAVDASVRPAGRSDVYLADRGMARNFKTSLHESGKWRTAVTDAALASGRVVLPPGADRKMTAWDRPPPMSNGLTLGYSIATPSSELRTTREKFEGQDIIWIADPGAGLAVQFMVLLGPPRLQSLTVSDPGSENYQVLDQFRLPNGELLALVSRCVPLAEDAIALIREVAGGLTVSAAGGGPMDRVRSALIVEGHDGGEAQIDVAIPCTV